MRSLAPVGSGSRALSKYRNLFAYVVRDLCALGAGSLSKYRHLFVDMVWDLSAPGAGFFLSKYRNLFMWSRTRRPREPGFCLNTEICFENRILFLYVVGDQSAPGAGFCIGTEICLFA